MQKLSGQEISESLIDSLKSKPTPKKILAAVLVGSEPSSISFLNQKGKAAKILGIDFRIYKFSSDLKNDDLRKEVGKISNQGSVGGVIIQLPLPEHINRYYILNVIPREKDVDVLGERAIGAVYAGRNQVLPPAAAVVKEICERQGYGLKNKNIVVLGIGIVTGKPVALWLMNESNNLTIIRSGGDLGKLREADLVISGAGKPGLIDPKNLKKGAAVIDFGYEEKRGKLSGDLDTSDEKSLEHLKFYTPTPGGTGPIVVAMLLRNFYELNGN
ncbi:MAG: bifunctional 5,10-methylenetetrahydrofolate dehydrogenase/5,10-methenyltetrahydrofolate cyclohydrolase [Candidatus Colwellbacteria bacterium]|nr:bifunctional 5,10-methylenetetrahydrofolate dehydrogenase/5,10-methenyltetrahydrofolate cyclohydrolase [Candidatus Colwellbacteria bacterium]